VAELVAWAKANPERANYGASGAGFQLPTELFNQRAGTRFQYIAYRGSAESVNAAANGEVTIALVDTGPASVAISAGRARALAVTSAARVPAYPEVPTMAELGFPEVEATLWSGLLRRLARPRRSCRSSGGMRRGHRHARHPPAPGHAGHGPRRPRPG
jgi:tripartite-type tricarboxylate transporter receptor subunit TctC